MNRAPALRGMGAARGSARGLVPGPPRAYLGGMLKYFARFSPLRAIRDLRRFLAGRQRYELFTLFAAAAVTWTIMWAFLIDSRSIEVPYERNIIYVQSWPLDRSVDDMRVQLKADEAKRREAIAAHEKRMKARQEKFKKIDDALRRWGI